MIKTDFYQDFLEYYDKAKVLQNANAGLLPSDTVCGDPLQDNVTIYDTINRKYAGFSKALEDIHGVRKSGIVRYPDYSDEINIKDFFFIHLFHRFTGSGASFQPTFLDNGTRNPKEHGYCNNHVGMLASKAVNSPPGSSTIAMIDYIVNCKEPMVTSVGNQPPSLKNPDSKKYRLAMQYYFDQHASDFVSHFLAFLFYRFDEDKEVGIKEAVDWCCTWHKYQGFKQWRFVLTAFVMDVAEYYPHLVDPTSHCYYGANCIRAFNLMFEKEPGERKIKKAEWNELCMSELVKARPQSEPYDMEDVCCDAIRYWVQYYPKGYDLPQELTQNRSILKVFGEYPDEVKRRLTEVIGYYDHRTKAKM